MLKLLGAIGGLAVLIMILFGTWPILFGKQPVKPLVKPEKLEKLKNQASDAVREFGTNEVNEEEEKQ